MEKMKVWLETFLSVGMERLLTATLILVGGIIAIRILMVLLKKVLEAGKLEKAAHTLIKSLVRVALWLLLAVGAMAGCMTLKKKKAA